MKLFMVVQQSLCNAKRRRDVSALMEYVQWVKDWKYSSETLAISNSNNCYAHGTPGERNKELTASGVFFFLFLFLFLQIELTDFLKRRP